MNFISFSIPVAGAILCILTVILQHFTKNPAKHSHEMHNKRISKDDIHILSNSPKPPLAYTNHPISRQQTKESKSAAHSQL